MNSELEAILDSPSPKSEKIRQVEAHLKQLYSDRELLDAVKAMVFGDHGRWKEHADKLEAMVKGASLDEATLALVGRVAQLRTRINLDQTVAETVPFLAGLLQWRRASCPHFALAPDFFHALSVTDYTNKEDPTPLKLPFNAFTMAFPKSPLLGNASRLFVYRVAGLSTGEPRWKWWRVTMYPEGLESIFSQWDDGITRGEFAGGDPELDKTPDRHARELKPHEAGWMRPARILIANVLAYIESKGPLPERRPSKGTASAPLERVRDDRFTFDVGKSVRLEPNLRRAFIASEGSGARWKLAQRFIVRGHWRRQAYGEGRALRKDLWIEPYFKGPEDIEAALQRTYDVGGPASE